LTDVVLSGTVSFAGTSRELLLAEQLLLASAQFLFNSVATNTLHSRLLEIIVLPFIKWLESAPMAEGSHGCTLEHVPLPLFELLDEVPFR
jgi:hypothetical protein